jgi:hypothetical protein
VRVVPHRNHARGGVSTKGHRPSGDIPTEDELDDDDEDDDDDEGEWETDDDTDADENGNLEGFIDDEEVSDSEAEYFA